MGKTVYLYHSGWSLCRIVLCSSSASTTIHGLAACLNHLLCYLIQHYLCPGNVFWDKRSAALHSHPWIYWSYHVSHVNSILRNLSPPSPKYTGPETRRRGESVLILTLTLTITYRIFAFHPHDLDHLTWEVLVPVGVLLIRKQPEFHWVGSWDGSGSLGLAIITKQAREGLTD